MRQAHILATLTASALLVIGSTEASLARTFIIPHILEVSGSTTAAQLGETPIVPRGVNLAKGPAPKTPVAVDTIIDVLYVGGLPGSSVGGGGLAEASADIYLYDSATGAPMLALDGTAVCNPCTASLSSTKRKESYRLDDFITKTRDPNGSVSLGYGVIVIGGADPDNVHVTSSVVVNTGKSVNVGVMSQHWSALDQ